MDGLRGNAPNSYPRMPPRLGDVPQRDDIPNYEPPMKEFAFPNWTQHHPPQQPHQQQQQQQGRGRHVSGEQQGFHFRGYRNGPPPQFYHEKIDTRYPPEEPYIDQTSWRPRGRKRRGSVPPGLDRARNHRSLYMHPEDQQREAADVRVRQQLQGFTIMKELCSKESYQRYLRLSDPHNSTTTTTTEQRGSSMGVEIDSMDGAEEEDDRMQQEVDGTEALNKMKEVIKLMEKKRKGPTYVICQKTCLFLNKEQADVLRLYYPRSC